MIRFILLILALVLGASAQTTNQYQLLKFNGATYDKAYATGTGSDNLVFSTSPTFITPNLGIPSTLTLTHATGLVLTSGVTGVLPVANGGTSLSSLGSGIVTWLGTPSSANLAAAMTDETGVGALVFANSPTMITPALGTPSAVVLTHGTGLPLSTGVTGILALANGGTGAALTDPGANTLIGWDDTDNLIKTINLGAGLTYTHSTHTLSASGGGGGSSITLTAPTWIDSAGNNGTGVIGDPAHPFLTLDGALASATDLELGAGSFAGNSVITNLPTFTIKGRGYGLTSVGDLSQSQVNASCVIQDAGFQSVAFGEIINLGADNSFPSSALTLQSVLATNVGTATAGILNSGADGFSSGALTISNSVINGTASTSAGDAPSNGNGGTAGNITINYSSISSTISAAAGLGAGMGSNGAAGSVTAYYSTLNQVTGASGIAGAFLNLGQASSAGTVSAIMSRVGANIYLDNQSAGNVIIGGGATASKLWLMEPSGSGTNKNTYESAAMAADIRNITPATIGATGDFDTITVSGSTATHSFGHDGSTLTALNASNISSGTLAVTRGGTGITSLGTGVATALGVNTGSAGAFVVLNGALGTPSSGTLSSCIGLPISGLTASTSTALGVGSIELGHASDTSITRVSAGVAAVEGVTIDTISAANTLTNKTLTSPTLTTPVLGTPSSGTLSNCTGLPIGGMTMNTAKMLGRTTGSSGVVEEISVGTGLSLSAGSLTATGGSGTKTIRVFTPENDQPPAANAALIGSRNSITFIGFNDSTEQYAIFVGIVPEAAVLGSGLSIIVKWIAATATTGDVVWGAQIERSNTDLDADSFDTAVTATTTTNGTSGIIATTTITNTNIDSVTAGDVFRLKLYRKAADVSDTEVGDAQVIAVEVRTAN